MKESGSRTLVEPHVIETLKRRYAASLATTMDSSREAQSRLSSTFAFLWDAITPGAYFSQESTPFCKTMSTTIETPKRRPKPQSRSSSPAPAHHMTRIIPTPQQNNLLKLILESPQALQARSTLRETPFYYAEALRSLKRRPPRSPQRGRHSALAILEQALARSSFQLRTC